MALGEEASWRREARSWPAPPSWPGSAVPAAPASSAPAARWLSSARVLGALAAFQAAFAAAARFAAP